MLTIRRKQMLVDLAISSGYLSISFFMEKYRISRRTVYYDIEGINKWLEDNFSVRIQYAKVAGYFLENEFKAQFNKNWNETDEEISMKYDLTQRKFRIFLKLFFSRKNVTLSDIQKLNNISKTTAIGDLKQLKSKDGVEIMVGSSGHYLNYDCEHRHRKYFFGIVQEYAAMYDYNLEKIMKYLSNFVEDGHILAENISKNLTILTNAKKNYGIIYTDEIRYLFSILAATINFRNQKGNYVKLIKDNFFLDNQLTFRKLSKELLNTNLVAELRYFETFLISGQLNGFPTKELETIKNSELFTISTQIVNNFEKLSGSYIDEKGKFISDLYSHIRGTYYRLIYSIPNKNPIIAQIKEKYPDIYSFTKNAVSSLEDYSGISLTEDEIGYIAIYFGGNIKKTMPLRKRKKVVLVCASGIGTGNLMIMQLKNEFPDLEILGPYSESEYKEIEQTLINVNLVLSTISIDTSSRFQFILIDSFLNEPKINEIANVLNINLPKCEKRHYIDGLLDIIERYSNILDEKELRSQLGTYIFKRNNGNNGGDRSSRFDSESKRFARLTHGKA